MSRPRPDQFADLVAHERRAGAVTVAMPMVARLLADHVTPVLAYRSLVAPDDRTAPSFLLESVEGGERQGRYSLLGSRPILQVTARGAGTSDTAIQIRGDARLTAGVTTSGDPLEFCRAVQARIRLVIPHGPADEAPPACFLGGWVGCAAYDSVRYAEPAKLGAGPRDDRGLPDVHFGLYDGVTVFDHVRKLVHVVQLAMCAPEEDPLASYVAAEVRLNERMASLRRPAKALPAGVLRAESPRRAMVSNMTPESHRAMVARAKEYIAAGDIFQVVVGQRFERISRVDPFDVYRALRTVNPSPYMVYLQAEGCILVASSPEILCRVQRTRDELVVTNRPLAGTRRRGATPEEDAALEQELLADPKERAEHIMLVDLGRNDVGRVCVPGSVALPAVMGVERYSHVMHISSTVTGSLRPGLDCWDALRAALPVGTISGAPKVRAMQIIDELEPVRRGPYGGGMGVVGLDGQMDIALALRTIVVPTAQRSSAGWTYHLQAAGGIVADSDPGAEFAETVNKAAALARAIDVAEEAFGPA